MEGGRFTGYHVGGVDGVVEQPSGRGRGFLNSIGARLDLVEHGDTRGIGLRRIGFAAFNVGDRDHGTG